MTRDTRTRTRRSQSTRTTRPVTAPPRTGRTAREVAAAQPKSRSAWRRRAVTLSTVVMAVARVLWRWGALVAAFVGERVRDYRSGEVRSERPLGRALSETELVREQRRREQRRSSRRQRVRIAAALFSVVAVAIAWWGIPRLGVFAIDQVEVEGASAVPDSLVRSRVDAVLEGKTIFTADLDEVERRVRAMPFVRSASIDRHVPGGITITVVEYAPLAFGYAGTRGWLIARNGRILMPGRVDDWRGIIPVVRLGADKVRAGTSVGNEPALQILRALPPTFPGQVHAVSTEADGSWQLTLEDGFVVRLGRDEQIQTKVDVAERLLGLLGPARRATLEYLDVSVPARPTIR